MSAYQTEEEQVEAIKKWWKENGKSVVGGALLGLAVVGGGKGWMEYNRMQAEGNSAQYESFLVSATEGDLQTAVTKGDALIESSGDSAYAAFTALELAKQQYQAGNKTQARSRLQWLVDNAKEPVIREIAQLRLARLLLDMEALDEASALAGAVTSGEFAGEFSMVAGDVAAAKGDLGAARAAYDKAMTLGVADSNLLQMKIASVGG